MLSLSKYEGERRHFLSNLLERAPSRPDHGPAHQFLGQAGLGLNALVDSSGGHTICICPPWI